ncbi:MAG: NifB/NifX family molybdenum-iron cluster-binding protein [Desulfovibrionaceae bacterium]
MHRKVALCLWEERIAPRYDRSQKVRIVTVADGSVVDETTFAVEHLSREELCKAIAAQKVQVLICGGVVDPCRRKLVTAGVEIIDNVIGGPQAVLARHLAGALAPGTVVD